MMRTRGPWVQIRLEDLSALLYERNGLYAQVESLNSSLQSAGFRERLLQSQLEEARNHE